MALWVILGIVAVLGLFLAGLFNNLVRRRNLVREAWSGVDVQLKRRANLIPNLLETVKGYMGHERSVLERVTQLRVQVATAREPARKAEVEGQLSQALDRLLALAEGYPDLKASANFIELQRALAAIEEEIQLARRFYNGAVRDLNNAVESFPGNLLAGPLGFSQAEFFELADPADRALPRVEFGGEEG